MPQRKWSKEIIIERLQTWHADGVPVKLLWRQDPAMTSRASSMFGSWRLALAAAGIESARKQWSRETIIEQLRQTRGRNRRVPHLLVNAAIREFGSMRRACKVAGVPCLTNQPPHLDWNKEKAIAAIRKRHDDGHSLRSTAREDAALYAAAKRLFGTWTAARATAGHPIPPKQLLPASEVIDSIKSCHRNGGHLPQLCESNPVLFRSAKHHFGSWTKAIDAAGLKTVRRNRWTPRSVVVAIQARHAAGHALCRTWREDKSLFRAAVRWFGSWADAMKTAGFEPIERERWTRQRVIERLRAWDERARTAEISTSEPKLTAVAIRLFGSLDKAFAEADIEVNPKRWTKARVIAAIQDSYIDGRPRHIVGLGDPNLASAAKRQFGSWAAAVEAAGLIEKIPIKPPLRRWNRAKVIAELRAWYDAGHRLAEVSTKYQALFNAAKTHFGSWNAAIEAADLEPERRFYTKEQLIAMIRQRHAADRSLSSGHPDNRALAMTCIRHFGSWRKALSAAGVVVFNRGRRGA